MQRTINKKKKDSSRRMQAKWNLLPVEKKRTKLDDDDTMPVVVYKEKISFVGLPELKESEDSNNGIVAFFRNLFLRNSAVTDIFREGPLKTQLGKILNTLPSRVFVKFNVSGKKTRKIGNVLYTNGFPRLVYLNGFPGCFVQIENPDDFTEAILAKTSFLPNIPNTFCIWGSKLLPKWYYTENVPGIGSVEITSNFRQVEQDEEAIQDD
jgi:hypothetical protein